MYSYQKKSRLYLQSRYQFNMMVGWLVAAMLAAVLAAMIGDGDTADGPVAIRSDVGFLTPANQQDKGGATAHGINPYRKHHDGFLGFDIRIVSQKSYPMSATPPIVSRFALPQLEADKEPSFSTAEGAGTYIPDFGFAAYYGTDTTKEKPSWPVRVIMGMRPMYPDLAERKGIEGYAAGLVHVGVAGEHLPINQVYEGRMVTGKYLILEEEPEGYHFGAALLEVLPLHVFAPRVEQGIPVDDYYVVRARFQPE